MPQMSPLQWELLFFASLLAIYVILTKLFFETSFYTEKTSSAMESKPNSINAFNWLW